MRVSAALCRHVDVLAHAADIRTLAAAVPRLQEAVPVEVPLLAPRIAALGQVDVAGDDMVRQAPANASRDLSIGCHTSGAPDSCSSAWEAELHV